MCQCGLFRGYVRWKHFLILSAVTAVALILLYMAILSSVRTVDPRHPSQVASLRVAIYAQMGNADPSIWEDLFSCIFNVASAQHDSEGEVDVFVSAVDDNPNIDMRFYKNNLSALEGVGRVEVRAVKNLEADIGQWFQQLLDTSLPSVEHYSAVLKIHSKSHIHWRRHMTEHLCGSPCVAREAIQTLAADRSAPVGILGPKDLVYVGANATFTAAFCQFIQCWPGDVGKRLLFHSVELGSMRWTWRQMKKKGAPFFELAKQNWSMIPGTFFWIRGSGTFLSEKWFHDSVPLLMKKMTRGYRTGSSGKAEHAMERWIATLVRQAGFSVAQMGKVLDCAKIEILTP